MLRVCPTRATETIRWPKDQQQYLLDGNVGILAKCLVFLSVLQGNKPGTNANKSNRFAFNMRYAGDEMRRRINDIQEKKTKIIFPLSRRVINFPRRTFNYRQPMIMTRCIIYLRTIGLQFDNISEV